MNKAKFNYQGGKDGISWARWSWNPITGCLGPDGKGLCNYCYARDIRKRFDPAERIYVDNFKPTFHPERLDAPKNTKIPKGKENEPGIHNVFAVSMGDLWGHWISDICIDQILYTATRNPQWNFMFLTKNPSRYLAFAAAIPPNAWIGATADTQERADTALDVFDKLDVPNVKFLSCEPLSERIFLDDAYGRIPIDWLIIGGRSRSTGMPAMQPKWEWVENLLFQAENASILVYFKPNLTVRPKQFPK